MMTMLVSEKNRLGTAISAVRPRIEAHIAWLEQELKDLDEGLRQTLLRSPVWREKDDLLRTVPGVGEQVSLTLLAYLKFGRSSHTACVGPVMDPCSSMGFVWLTVKFVPIESTALPASV